jgi:predicted DNA-binding protein with PD1-like motif
MQYRQVADAEETTYVVVLDEGDEVVAELSAFARERGLSSAQLTAVGAFSSAVLGWFDRQAKDYRRIPVDEQCEVLSIIGDVALNDGEPALHAHCVVGLPDGTTRGGHLLEGQVWPTLEVVVRESPARLQKTMRPDVGLALIDLSRTEG